jgi:hypothetical protein
MARKVIFLIGFIVLFSLTACAARRASSDPAGNAVITYLQAVVSGDADRVTVNSCKSWESQAMMEMDSFAGVKANLDQAVCKTTETSGSTSSVECSGKIKATYNNEQQEFDLSGRVYQVSQEGGEWLVCGYK